MCIIYTRVTPVVKVLGTRVLGEYSKFFSSNEKILFVIFNLILSCRITCIPTLGCTLYTRLEANFTITKRTSHTSLSLETINNPPFPDPSGGKKAGRSSNNNNKLAKLGAA